ncbi:hypothetical protein MMPV_009427 [Pyropia vietnamensis]
MSVRDAPPGVPPRPRGSAHDGSPLAAKRSFMARLRKLIPQVAEALAKTQQRYKKGYDLNIARRNTDVRVGDYVYTVAHRRLHKLDAPVLGPFLVVDRDDKTFVVQVGDDEERVSSDQVTPAPRPPDVDSSQSTPHALLRDRVNLTAQPSTKDDYLMEKLVGYREVDGERQLRVRCGYLKPRPSAHTDADGSYYTTDADVDA